MRVKRVGQCHRFSAIVNDKLPFGTVDTGPSLLTTPSSLGHYQFHGIIKHDFEHWPAYADNSRSALTKMFLFVTKVSAYVRVAGGGSACDVNPAWQ
jgi:hypothetical protein